MSDGESLFERQQEERWLAEQERERRAEMAPARADEEDEADARRADDSLREFRQTCSELDVLRVVECAARELDDLLGGDLGAWRLDGRLVTERAGDRLISLHAYLNDVTAWRSTG